MDSFPIPASASPLTASIGAPNGAVMDAPSLPATGIEPVRGADFANLFKHLMDPTGRQDLAAATVPGLQSLALSPNLNLITAAGPLPDNASLLAFARSQGLDDATLGALFAPACASLPVEAATVQATSPPFNEQAQALAVSLALPTAFQAQAPLQEGLSLSEQLATQPVFVQLVSVTSLPQGLRLGAQMGSACASGASPSALLAAAVAARQLAHDTLKTAGATSQASPAVALAVNLPAAEQAVLAAEVAQTAPEHLALPSAKLVRTSAGLAAGAPAEASALAAAGSDNDDPAVRAAALAVATTPASRQVMQDSLLLRLQPQLAIAERLAAMAASGEQAMWKQISAQPAGDLETLALGLGPEWKSTDALGSADPLISHPHGSSSPTAEALRSQLGTHSPELNAPASTAAERVAQYEQLAQRLGRALGERLQAQIERGEWKVRLQMDPAALGRIDMELDMRAGGLDAMFRSDNQLTRELISQSLPRLRETLAQSGTAVANVWVQGESQRQTGGNPTPGRQGQSERGGRPSEEGTTDSLAVSSQPRVSTSNWDLMA